MYGHHGRILHVDSEAGKGREEGFDEGYARLFLGGNGFGARILYDAVPAGVDPFHRDNVIVFAVGPATDTALPSNSRCCVVSKSPLTGLIFDSTFGGRFSVTQKRTGCDAIALRGKAPKPIYVAVTPQGVEMKDAGHLWGKSAHRTIELIRSAEGSDADVAAIGPAGENRVRFACLTHTWKSRGGIAGRGGMGAVLGSKNVKALVVKGSARTAVADPDGLKALISETKEAISKGTAALSGYGTPMLVHPINAVGGMGIRNLQAEFTPRSEEISGERFKELFYEKDTTCSKCTVACGKQFHIREGEFGGSRVKMPEYESIYALGPMTENFRPDAILMANELCNDLGMDSISMGLSISFAMECVERGLLSEKDAGFPLRFGDTGTILKLIELTSRREGFGDLLAEGSLRMSEKIGGDSFKYLACAKGLELPGHSARALKGMSIGYATGTRGGSHQDARPTMQYSPTFDRRGVEGKAEYAIRTQNFTAFGDSLTQCRFVGERGFGTMINDTHARALNAITGWDLSVEEVERLGERIVNLERMFNVREGVRRADDTLPHRAMHEPIPDGPSKGMHCPPEELEAMLDEYYQLRGWDQDGVPTRKKLLGLNLNFCLKDLE